MIVTPSAYGRMANRLILVSNWIANAEETGIGYAHLRFGYYARYYKNLRHRPILTYTPTTRSEVRPKHLIKIFDVSKTLDLTNTVVNPLSEPFLDLQRSTRLLFTLGWHYRCPEAVLKHRDKIQEFFRPAEPYETTAAQFTERAREGTDNLIGVHIRRTDYATFNDGKWFYDDTTYADIMKKTANICKGRTRFVLYTDSDIDISMFGELDVIAGPKHEFVDNLCLSACDKIIGPPSTYSKWAAFIGRVPRYVIRDASDPINEESFVIPIDL